MPTQVYIEEKALDYPLGRHLQNLFALRQIPITMVPSHNQLNIPGSTSAERFHRAKETLVVGVKRDLNFRPCRPSADFRLVENTSCPGKCQYCYLAANLGERIYPRVYVNVDEILLAARRKIQSRIPELTTFEASSSSDPVALEHFTGSLAKTIEFFRDQPYGGLRVATKFAAIEPFLALEHGGHTRFRYSLNTERIIREYEEGTAPLEARLQGSRRLAEADYPIGFIIAPLMIYPQWQEEYGQLLDRVREVLGPWGKREIPFELIMHRFTARSKRLTQARFPQSTLDFDAAARTHKGFGKYVYTPKKAQELAEFFQKEIPRRFPQGTVAYFT